MADPYTVADITGTITLTDGTTITFTIGTDGGWQQWGATRDRLGQSVDVVEAMARALLDDELLATDHDTDDQDLEG